MGFQGRRGIDVAGITHVIDFELPNEPECYVHRIGRTARAGANGVALSLCATSEYALLRDIEALIRMPITVDGGERPSGVVRAGRRGARPEPCGERTRRDDFHRRISLEGTMARKPNYNFEKRQREIQKKEKKAAKAEAKRLQAEARKEGEGQKSETPSAGGSA